MKNDLFYVIIKNFYKDKTANRSGVRLMNHIDEGLVILDSLGASTQAKQAFCIHPIMQSDEDLNLILSRDSDFINNLYPPKVIMLAMEYRSVANEYLSDKCNGSYDLIRISSVEEVNKMLIADKIQNKKDFRKYHLGTHDKSDVLEIYFDNWLRALSVSEILESELTSLISGEES